MNGDGGRLLAIVLAEHWKNVKRGALASSQAELRQRDSELLSIRRCDGTRQRACAIVGDGIALSLGRCTHLAEGCLRRWADQQHRSLEVEVEALEVVEVVVVADEAELVVARLQAIDGEGGEVVHTVYPSCILDFGELAAILGGFNLHLDIVGSGLILESQRLTISHLEDGSGQIAHSAIGIFAMSHTISNGPVGGISLPTIGHAASLEILTPHVGVLDIR